MGKEKEITGLVKGYETIGRTVSEDESKTSRSSYRKAGHLVDQQLKYRYPGDNQLSIFDHLRDDTKRIIEKRGVEITELVEGINLSPGESKVIDSLCKLLHKNSSIDNPEDLLYYAGGNNHTRVAYGGEKLTTSPKISFTLFEITKEYTGFKKKISGKDIMNVKRILLGLDQKNFLLKYKEVTPKKNGGRSETKIEEFKKLIHILSISQVDYDKDNLETSKKEEMIVMLNPIFRRQIDRKFVLYPDDITQRTILAYGSPHVSNITIRLRDYILRELSSKHYEPEISLHKLYYQLAEGWMEEGRKKKVREYTEKAFIVMEKLGLIISYEIRPAKITGEPKVIFKINKDFLNSIR